MTMQDEQRRAGSPKGAADEAEIRWDEAAAFLRQRLGLELSGPDRGQIDDLVQEALVRLLRAVRREPVENLEALMTEIARRTAIDCLRRRIRWSAVIRDEPVELDRAVDRRAQADAFGDPVDRLHFVVLEFFTVHDARCRELAVAYFAEQDWKSVAAARGLSHLAVRKQWSRCLERLREAAHDESGALMDALRRE